MQIVGGGHESLTSPSRQLWKLDQLFTYTVTAECSIVKLGEPTAMYLTPWWLPDKHGHLLLLHLSHGLQQHHRCNDLRIRDSEKGYIVSSCGPNISTKCLSMNCMLRPLGKA